MQKAVEDAALIFKFKEKNKMKKLAKSFLLVFMGLTIGNFIWHGAVGGSYLNAAEWSFAQLLAIVTVWLFFFFGLSECPNTQTASPHYGSASNIEDKNSSDGSEQAQY